VKSKYSNVLILVLALISFAPVLLVDLLLDGYARTQETDRLQERVEHVAAEIHDSVLEGVRLIEQVLLESPSLCTPTFFASIHKWLDMSPAVGRALVENADGVQYCDSHGRELLQSPLSEPLGFPGRSETLSVVALGPLSLPNLKLTRKVGAQRLLSVFIPLLPSGLSALSFSNIEAGAARVRLANGFAIAGLGDVDSFDTPPREELIAAYAYAGALPIRVDMQVPFNGVRGNYRDLDVALTLMACLVSALTLVGALHYARRTQLPAFDLERAIAVGELKPFYQPVIDLATGRLSGCEVLIRWEKRSGEIVPPGSFIDYAEATGLAIPMTLRLMQQVKSDLDALCADMPDLKVSINLFEGHFRDAMIVEDVQAIFGGSNINYRQLVFEITERLPLGNTMQADGVIAGLHALGCRLAIDDVGTGHSNLAVMQTLGVDIIKIDRIFIDMVKPESTQVPVLDGLIAMARDLGADIVAEGVETEAQALYLRSRGVRQVQGFLFAPAIRANAFIDLARALNAPSRPAGAELKLVSVQAA